MTWSTPGAGASTGWTPTWTGSARAWPGCASIRPGRGQIEDILHGCVGRTGLRDAYVSMTCTRGRVAPGSRDIRTARSTFYCYAVPFVWISSPDQQEAGASLWISPVTRIPPESVDPTSRTPLAGHGAGPAGRL